MKLVLLGPPGSGKGTIAEQLEQEWGWKHISAGELLREEVRQGTPIGKDIQHLIDKGNFVPDQLIVEIVKLEIGKKKDVILDGFPRTVEQAEAIKDIKINKVLFLDVPEKAVVERLSGRRVCRKGDHNYHLEYLPPRKKGICDLDGTPLARRKDDDPKAVGERFKVYHQQTEPLVAYYQKKGLLQKVDASPPPDKVYAAVRELLAAVRAKR